MALLEQWRSMAYSETANKGDLKRLWQKYFLKEKEIYAQLLEDPDTEVKGTVKELAEKYNVTDSAIAVAWILRHPAGIQTIIGTTNKDRIAQISKASLVNLTREEWYRLYMAAGNQLP